MNIARFEYRDKVGYGVIKNDCMLPVVNSIFDDEIQHKQEERIDLKEIRLLAPTLPSKIVCVGLNYRDHAKELSMDAPDEPIIFLKPPTTIIGPGDDIVYPAISERVDYEAELGVIIRKTAKDISKDSIGEYILGYTCLNDITARDLQKKDGQWTRAKSFDTFCPIGPYITTEIEPDNLKIELSVNGETMQSSSTKEMIFDVDYIVSFISNIMTLFPGDIIATGTPKGVGPLARGDSVQIDIENIGSLVNKII